MLRKELLDILCCPKCKSDLLYAPEKETLTCARCGIVYPVRNDVPIMIVEDHETRSGVYRLVICFELGETAVGQVYIPTI